MRKNFYTIFFLCPLVLVFSCRKVQDDVKPDDKPPISFVYDTDSNRYATVKIGRQWWMAENLRVKHFNDGKELPQLAGSELWAETSDGGWSAYLNDTEVAEKTGLLYNGYAALADAICPCGWHVPSEQEWEELIAHVGSYRDAGAYLKISGFEYWERPNTGAGNSSGFSAQGGGGRFADGRFIPARYTGTFWSSHRDSETTGLAYRFFNSSTEVLRMGNQNVRSGFSVRCVKNGK